MFVLEYGSEDIQTLPNGIALLTAGMNVSTTHSIQEYTRYRDQASIMSGTTKSKKVVSYNIVSLIK